MNVYDAIGFAAIRIGIVEEGIAQEACVALLEVAKAWNALAPNWSEAPEWAQWMTLFDNGKRIWWEKEPTATLSSRGDYTWLESTCPLGMATSEITSPLPLGIDWRLCKWQRQEVGP